MFESNVNCFRPLLKSCIYLQGNFDVIMESALQSMQCATVSMIAETTLMREIAVRAHFFAPLNSFVL